MVPHALQASYHFAAWHAKPVLILILIITIIIPIIMLSMSSLAGFPCTREAASNG